MKEKHIKKLGCMYLEADDGTGDDATKCAEQFEANMLRLILSVKNNVQMRSIDFTVREHGYLRQIWLYF